MRLRYILTALLLLSVTSLPAFAQQSWGRPHPPKSGACFYADPGFRGEYFCLKHGERWPSLPPGFNDRITSIRVFGGARLRVFNDDNFGGISALIAHDVDDLRSFRLPENPYKSWNDRISSIAVFRENDEWERHDHDQGQQPYQGQPPYQPLAAPPPYQGQPQYQPLPAPPPYQGEAPYQASRGVGACFYLDADFRGEYFCMKEGERLPFVPSGFNDRISSIRVFGGVRVRVFNDPNFSGINIVFDHDMRNLTEIPLADNPFKNWNDRITSVAVVREHDEWERHDQDHPRH